MTPNTLPEFDLEKYLPYRLTVQAARLSMDMAQQYKSEFGISIPEWRVLVNIGYAENLSVRDIEKRVSLEKSMVSRAAARLEARGLVSKTVDTKDRRLVKLELTEEGALVLGKLIPIASAFQADLERKLGAEKDALFSALDRLAD